MDIPVAVLVTVATAVTMATSATCCCYYCSAITTTACTVNSLYHDYCNKVYN